VAHKSHTSPLSELIVAVWEPGKQDVVSWWTDYLMNHDLYNTNTLKIVHNIGVLDVGNL